MGGDGDWRWRQMETKDRRHPDVNFLGRCSEQSSVVRSLYGMVLYCSMVLYIRARMYVL